MGVNVAVLAVSDKLTVTDEPTAKQVIDRLTEAGHRIVAREVVADSEDRIRAHLLAWIGDPEVDVVIATIGLDAESAGDALAPLVTKPLRGFSDLFRMLSYEEIGTAAMLVDVEAAQCGSTFVFFLPASSGAIRTALEKILIPQLDVRTKPRNLAMKLRRHQAEPSVDWNEPAPGIKRGNSPSVAPAVAHIPAKAEAAPTAAAIFAQNAAKPAAPMTTQPLPVRLITTTPVAGVATKRTPTPAAGVAAAPVTTQPGPMTTQALPTPPHPTPASGIAMKPAAPVTTQPLPTKLSPSTSVAGIPAKTISIEALANAYAKPSAGTTSKLPITATPAAGTGVKPPITATPAAGMGVKPSTTATPAAGMGVKPSTGTTPAAGSSVKPPIGTPPAVTGSSVKPSSGTTPGATGSSVKPSTGTTPSIGVAAVPVSATGVPASPTATVKTPPMGLPKAMIVDGPVTPPRYDHTQKLPSTSRPERTAIGPPPAPSVTRGRPPTTPPPTPGSVGARSTTPAGGAAATSGAPMSGAPHAAPTSAAPTSGAPTSTTPAAPPAADNSAAPPRGRPPNVVRAVSIVPEVATPSDVPKVRDTPIALPLIRASVIVDESLVPASDAAIGSAPVVAVPAFEANAAASATTTQPLAVFDEAVSFAPDTHAVTTGVIGTIDDLPVFAGDSFSTLERPSRKKGWFVWLGLGVATATAIILFLMFRSTDKTAVASNNHGEHFDHVAARTKAPDSKPSDVEPAQPAPIETPTPPTSIPELARPSPHAQLKQVDPRPVADPAVTPSPRGGIAAVTPRPGGEIAAVTPGPRGELAAVKHVDPAPRNPAGTPPVARPVTRIEPKPEPEPEETRSVAPVAEGCDEVSCVLDHYDRTCCKKWEPRAPSARPATAMPGELDRGMVMAGMDKMKPVVIRCGEKWSATGTVKLSVQVDGDGHVTDVSVLATPDAGLGNCVMAAIRKATFGKSVNGGSFKYPFAF